MNYSWSLVTDVEREYQILVTHPGLEPGCCRSVMTSFLLLADVQPGAEQQS